MKSEEANQHGGRREGAGRKPTGAKAVSFSATVQTQQILQNVKHKSDFINAAIEHYANMQPDGTDAANKAD